MSNPSQKLTSGQGLVHSAAGGLNRHALPPQIENYSFMQQFRALRAQQALFTGVCTNIICAGHSWVEAQTWVSALRATLQAKYGDGGAGYCSFGQGTAPCFDIQTAGTWTTKSGTTDATVEGIDLYSVNSSDIATPATKTLRVIRQSCDTMVVHYYCRTGGGSFSWVIDGSAPTTVSTNSAAGYSTLSITGLAPSQNHTLVLTVTAAGSAGVTLMGVDCQANSTVQNCVRVHGIGHAGTTTGQWAAVNAANWQFGLAALTPSGGTVNNSIFLWECTINDASAGVAGATFAANISTIIGRVKAANLYSDVIIIGDPDNGLVGTATAALNDFARDKAQVLGVSYLDLGLSWGPYSVSNGRGDPPPAHGPGASLLWTGANHPSGVGGEQIAGSIISVIAPDDPRMSFTDTNVNRGLTFNGAPYGNTVPMTWTSRGLNRWILEPLQNSESALPPVSASDLAVDAGNVLKVTSAAHSFVAGDVGRYMNILGVGVRTISSVAAGAAILSAAGGVAGSTGGTYSLGSNTGSDFNLFSYDDAGSLLRGVIQINRATGVVTIPHIDTSVFPVPSSLVIDDPGHALGYLFWQTAELNRWAIFGTQGAEGGGNTGSYFRIYRYDDAGIVISKVLEIDRVAGVVAMPDVSIGNSLKFPSQAAGTGNRYVVIDTAGNITSSPIAPVGT